MKQIIVVANGSLALALLVAGCTGATDIATEEAETPANSPGESTATGSGSGRIVFAGDRPKDSGFNLYVMNADGSNVQPVTDTFVAAVEPAVSPDGSRVAFWTTDGGVPHIYTVNLDGSDLTQMTDFSSFGVAWSPDGSHLVFVANDQNEQDNLSDIFSLDLSSLEITELLDTPTVRAAGARWSPDGTRIIFSSNVNGQTDLYVMDGDGSNLTQLTDDPYDDTHPDWSPDGTKIAWSTCVESDNYDIWLMDADGSNKTGVLETEAEEEYPAWSPDGTRLAFTSDQTGNYEIYTMNLDGTDVIQLTENEGNDMMPDWAP